MTSWVAGAAALLTLVIIIDAASLVMPSDDKNKTDEGPPDKWFTQYLDHFNITDNREWKQRYQVITDYYKEGGPAFLSLGGEWTISGKTLLKDTATAFAKKFNAIVFQLEHRFYGQSHPTSDVSTENLHYLSADQALADAAYFIKGMNVEHELPAGTKWVAFGGSYAANLAAWLRDKYAHLVYAAVADSGPVRAKVNFFEYENVVRDTLARYSSKCVEAIQEAHVKVKELLKTTEGQCSINTKFKLCDPINVTNKRDVYNLLASLADNFSGVVQYNGSSNTTVKTVCDIMLNTSVPDVVDRYAEVNTLVELGGETNCTDYKFDKWIEEMKKNVSWEGEKVVSGMRQWYYQTCTEYGYYQTSTEDDHLFYKDIPLCLFIEQCSGIYGDVFNKDLVYKGKFRTNTIYGGLKGQATRVVYIYSEGDPWHALGNNATKIPESPVIFVKGASHCPVIYEPVEKDSQEVKDAWKKVQDYVGKWCT